MFKKDWERAAQNMHINPHTLQAMVDQARPNEELLSYEVLTQGCANLNIKLTLANASHPLLLRIYIRDQEAADREQKIALLIGSKVPTPEIYFVGDLHGHKYALIEFMPGILLRDLLLQHPSSSWENVMEDVGHMVSVFHSYHFLTAGFFDKNLNIIHEFHPHHLVDFVEKYLQNSHAQNHLEKKMIQEIHEAFHSYPFPLSPTPSLVHGDYDPANILVDKKDGKWHISAILDWEFSHAGDWLLDISNMLRYAHQMPTTFESSFIKGLQKGGLILPENWRTTVHLSNLAALLDCLTRSDPDLRPHQTADICALIKHSLGILKHP